MSNPKHTPGPWKVESRTTQGQFVTETHIVAEDGSHIAEVSPCEIEPNARLIAAAPELLEALRPLQVWAEHARREARAYGREGEADYMGELADNARAAVAKAEGN